MSYPDANIQAALERQAERVRAVQAVGADQGALQGAEVGPVAESAARRWAVGRARRTLAMAGVVVGLLLVFVVAARLG